MSERTSIHGQWSSRWAFILAASGAAVGLGNIWKFPYIAGQNGGGAFVLLYLLFVIVLGLPIMMAEILIGRRSRSNPATAFSYLAAESSRSQYWRWAGYLLIAAGFLILSYYSVIAGWAIDYVFQAAEGRFTGANAQTIDSFFTALTASPGKLLFWHSAIMLSTALVVMLGIRDGLERAIYFMFPTMLALLLILVGYSMSTGHFAHGFNFLFQPKYDHLTEQGALVALGHAFFTLSLATGSIMMYGSYVPKNISIMGTSIFIAFADTLIALVAGLAIFPLVFAHGLEPGAGPGLIFKTLPLAFGHMPYGQFFGTLFFIMLVFAAFTSAISLLEPTVSWLIETRGWSRAKAAFAASFGIWLVGLGTVFSFNILENCRLFGLNFFELMDELTANIMLPVGGLAIAIFTGWYMKQEFAHHELELNGGWSFKAWRFCLRYLAPLSITLILMNILGVFG